MNVFKRPCDFNLFSELLSGRIAVLPSQVQQVQFDAWLEGKMATPSFCHQHKRTALIPDRATFAVTPVYKHELAIADIRAERTEMEIVPNLFNVAARLRCPACRCAHALCPPEFHTTSFDTFDTSTPERAAMLARAREFAGLVNKHGCGFALLVGSVGPGKTRLACNIVSELDNGDALYVRWGQLTNALRATYNQRREYDDDSKIIEVEHPLKMTQEVRFLVLDEIGCNALANDERQMLDELLKHRYDQRKPTILISNLPLDQFKEFVGDALHDRIRHAAGKGKFILQFQGGSYRRSSDDNYNYIEGHG